MERRKFLGMGAGMLAVVAAAPTMVMATNYREKLPKAWEIHNNEKSKGEDMSGVNAAIKAVFGTDKVEAGKVKLKAPDIAENGAVVPVSIKAPGAKRIALLQTADPEALVAIWDVPERGIPNYSIRIKMQQTGHVVVVAEIDGKLYKADKVVKVTVGGCGG
ncbi:thiosulfate oxidation carrier protein SoxY [Nitratifractor salsuginis]|uniref:Thiosulfate-binding protein SoxY n=1 Tax=Nitratifractor salsuginis (strain DSM 16511 / JCM 12458 / E9I37-1) TaxID=749222 RepID=E6WZX6_NITSE|nr:thiosulfate oxidation carrier protein SoxY [Nitratifractor salsuginis]ADV45634.1 thiosulfate-binding protein SoxY [Nitratifractor salsuginis DSM 16511]